LTVWPKPNISTTSRKVTMQGAVISGETPHDFVASPFSLRRGVHKNGRNGFGTSLKWGRIYGTAWACSMAVPLSRPFILRFWDGSFHGHRKDGRYFHKHECLRRSPCGWWLKCWVHPWLARRPQSVNASSKISVSGWSASGRRRCTLSSARFASGASRVTPSPVPNRR